jgi:methyl-accepting chemotaxis protein
MGDTRERTRRAGDLTHDHLEEMGRRFEESLRREIDYIREDVVHFRSDVKEDLRQVHARVSEVRDKVREQNGRVGKCEVAIAALRQLSAGVGLSSSAVDKVEQTAKAASEMSKPRLAAVLMGLLVALAGFLEVARSLGDVFLQWLTKGSL